MKAINCVYTKVSTPDGERDYAMVKDRLRALYETYGDEYEISINTRPELIERMMAWKVEAVVTLKRHGMTHSFYGNATRTIGTRDEFEKSALEWAETAAVGRALAFAGIGISNGIASVEEIKSITVPFLDELKYRFERKRKRGISAPDSVGEAAVGQRMVDDTKSRVKDKDT